MSAFSNLTLNTKVYAPADIAGGTGRWMERSGGYGTSFSPLTLRMSPPAAGVRNWRVTSTMLVPVVAPSDSAQYVAGTFLRQISAEIKVTIPASSTPAEREDFRLRLQAYIASATFAAAVDDLEGVSY